MRTKFQNMLTGLAVSMGFFEKKCNGMNICQIYNFIIGKDKHKSKKESECLIDIVLLLRFISDISRQTKIKPDEQLNLTDKETLLNIVNEWSTEVSGITFKENFLQSAYQAYKNFG